MSMPLKNLLYLAQLEEYDTPRIRAWLKKHPGVVVEERKKRLVWTGKAQLIFLLASVFSPFIGREDALFLALECIFPADQLMKTCIGNLAKAKRTLFHKNMRVIAVAGSWGKTTAKETITKMLESRYRVCKTTGNTNTYMGVANLIFKLPTSCEIFVCEMDAYIPGELQSIAELVQPEIGVVTAVGPMHLERFGSMDKIKQSVLELAEVVPLNGRVFLPELLKTDVKKASAEFFTDLSEVYQHIGKHFGLSPAEITTPLSQKVIVEHRAQVSHANGVTIIDDSYNSNPSGFRRALELLAKTPAKKRILVTPGMIELGPVQSEENEKAAREATKVCDVIIVVGLENKDALMTGASKAKKRIWVQDLDEAQRMLAKEAETGSAVLFENDLPDQYI